MNCMWASMLYDINMTIIQFGHQSVHLVRLQFHQKALSRIEIWSYYTAWIGAETGAT